MSQNVAESENATEPPPDQLMVARYPAYHDYSNVSNAWIEQRQRELLPTKGRGNSGAKKMFPIQLYRMLEAVDGTQHSLLIRWLPHGRAFVVLEANRFAAEVLPTYFPSQTKFTSFQRQLNIYGFLRCVRVDDGYYHELFLRGRPVLATLIPRLSQGPYATRRTFDPDSEPDFYAMTWLPDVVIQADGLVNDGSVMGAVAGAAPTDTYSSVLSFLLPLATPRLQPRLPPSSQMPRPTRRNKSISVVRHATQPLDGIFSLAPAKATHTASSNLVAGGDTSAAFIPQSPSKRATHYDFGQIVRAPVNAPVLAATDVAASSARHATQPIDSDQSEIPAKRTKTDSSSYVASTHEKAAVGTTIYAMQHHYDAAEATKGSQQLENEHLQSHATRVITANATDDAIAAAQDGSKRSDTQLRSGSDPILPHDSYQQNNEDERNAMAAASVSLAEAGTAQLLKQGPVQHLSGDAQIHTLPAQLLTQTPVQLVNKHLQSHTNSVITAKTTAAAMPKGLGGSNHSIVQLHGRMDPILSRDGNLEYKEDNGDASTAAIVSLAVAGTAHPTKQVTVQHLGDDTQIPASPMRDLVDWGDTHDSGNLERNSTSSDDDVAEWAEFLDDVDLDD